MHNRKFSILTILDKLGCIQCGMAKDIFKLFQTVQTSGIYILLMCEYTLSQCGGFLAS